METSKRTVLLFEIELDSKDEHESQFINEEIKKDLVIARLFQDWGQNRSEIYRTDLATSTSGSNHLVYEKSFIDLFGPAHF